MLSVSASASFMYCSSGYGERWHRGQVVDHSLGLVLDGLVVAWHVFLLKLNVVTLRDRAPQHLPGGGQERRRHALSADTTGAPGAVDVHLRVTAELGGDHRVQVANVDAARRHVGGDQQLEIARSRTLASAASRLAWLMSPWMGMLVPELAAQRRRPRRPRPCGCKR